MNTPYYLSHMGCLCVKGDDALRFLQGQLTCHVALLNTYDSCLGAHCNHQGRVISLFHLFRDQTGFCLFMPRNMIALTYAALKKYIVFFKCELHDASDDYFLYGCWKDTLHQTELAVNQTMIKVPVSETRFFLINHLKPPARLKQEQHSQQEWQLANINELLPTIYPETSGHFLPHDLNLVTLGAVHFDKGCYTGQEIIARMHYRGKIKKRLYRAIINNHDVQPGDSISKQDKNGEVAGEVVDACVLDEEKSKLLIVMNENDIKQKLFMNQDNELIPVCLDEEMNYD